MTALATPLLPPIAWGAQALWQQLEPRLPGLTVEVLASVASTNTTLLQRIRGGNVAPALLVAETQTQGRGRLGRTWQSSAGASLTFSLAVRLQATDWSGLSLAVGLALADALDPLAPGDTPRIGLKWPNDLMLSLQGQPAHKLGGILIESLPIPSSPPGRRMAVIGIGLNIAPRADTTNAAALSQGYAGLQSLHPSLDAVAALARVAAPLVDALQAFEREGFAPLRERFAARDVLAGRLVATTLADLPEGLADGVDSDGALWLRVGERRHRVCSGEVSVRARLAQAIGEPAC